MSEARLTQVRALAEASRFLAVLSVVRSDGSVHSSLVSAGVTDDPETGAVSIAAVVGGATRKLELLRVTGRATATFSAGFQWVSVDGPVHLIGPADPAAAPGLDVATTVRDVFRAAGGTHDDWDEFDRVMAAEERCAVFIAAERIITNA